MLHQITQLLLIPADEEIFLSVQVAHESSMKNTRFLYAEVHFSFISFVKIFSK